MSLTCVPPPWRPQVQLCETRRELQELKASLRVAQKEKEQLLMEKQVSVRCVVPAHTPRKKDIVNVPSGSVGSDHLAHVDSPCVDLGNSKAVQV